MNTMNHSPETLQNLYYHLVKPRLIEEKMLILLRQGKITKWFSGIGQEAISVGATLALHQDEKIFTMHRNLGVFTAREVPLTRLFCQWQGKQNGFTKGRDRSFHFGIPEYHIIGMISHLGPQLSLASGVALAHKLKKQNKIAIAFTGEGATSQGEFHEALNVAAVWSLPVMFIIENNMYGLSTPIQEQYACKELTDKAIGYGIESITLDGNNIMEVYNSLHLLAEDMRQNPRPIMVECKTFRMRGHEEASGIKYVPQELFEQWSTKDPIAQFEKALLQSNVITSTFITETADKIKAEINTSWHETEKAEDAESTELKELNDVYFPHIPTIIEPKASHRELRFVDAISEGLSIAMDKHQHLVLMGQDIAEYGGAFKITQGFVDKFGKHRVRNTPLCESAIIGIGLGLSIENMKAMIEMQFADFVTCGFNQIVNNLAKLHYRWEGKADVVIRMPTGGGVGAGPFHSQSNEAWFTHTPGLKVVYPSNAYDAKGLLLASFDDPNPVMFFEHKALYRQNSSLVPEEYYLVEIGKAKIVNTGHTATIITYGMGVHWAMSLVQDEKLDIEIIDLRSLAPLDYNTIVKSVQKTGKVLILHEDTLFGGIGGEISAYISEHCFEYLDAPILRAAGLDTPIPFASAIESKIFMPIERLKNKITQLLSY